MSNHAESFTVTGASRVQIGNNYYYGATDQEEDKQCLAALRTTDPREDKIRIEQTKGGLLKDSYRWVLDSPEFRRWRNLNQDCPLLWIKGDPGKGKTMLLCGIIDELQPLTKLRNEKSGISLSYFFCQATNSGLDNATAVLRGLVYLLVVQQPHLLAHLRGKQGQSLDHWNSRVAIEDTFSKIVSDPAIQSTYLVVDALDECHKDLESLLRIVGSYSSPRIRWLVSSRKRVEIGEYLEPTPGKISLSLELNETSVSLAVDHYIRYRVGELGARKKLKSDVLKRVEEYLLQHAHGTFLWVALVCQHLETRRAWAINEQTRAWDLDKQLLQLPPGLNPFYQRMMEQIGVSSFSELYIKILAISSTAYRPIAYSELLAIENLPGDKDMLSNIIMDCGSFLTVRDNVIYLVHESAKEFLLKKSAMTLFPQGIINHHRDMFRSCLHAMRDLRMDMYGLVHPGVSMEEVTIPQRDPLSGLSYACIFWANHLRDAHQTSKETSDAPGMLDKDKVSGFMAEKLLFWLEALSLRGSLSAAVGTLQILQDLLIRFPGSGIKTFINDARRFLNRSDSNPELVALLEDARRFLLYFRPIIDTFPLQIYASGLLFSPEKSVIRGRFKQYSPKFVTTNPPVDKYWGQDLRVFEADCSIGSLNFSPSGQSLAGMSTDSRFAQSVIWKVEDGTVDGTVDAVMFRVEDGAVHERVQGQMTTLSSDLQWFAACSVGWPERNLGNSNSKRGKPDCLRICHLESAKIKWTAQFHGRSPIALKASPDCQWLAVCFDEEVELWSVDEGRHHQTWNLASSFERWRTILEFSSDGTMLAIFSRGSANHIIVLDVRTGECHQSPEIKGLETVVFVPDTHELMLGDGKVIRHWSISERECREWTCLPREVSCLACSADGYWLVAGCSGQLSFFGVKERKLLKKVTMIYSWHVGALAISLDNKYLALSSGNKVWLWDFPAVLAGQLYGRRAENQDFFVSDNGKWIVVALGRQLQVWDATAGQVLALLDMPALPWPLRMDELALSSQCELLAFGGPSEVFVFDVARGKRLCKFKTTGVVNIRGVFYDPSRGCHVVAGIKRENVFVFVVQKQGSVSLWNATTSQVQISPQGSVRRPIDLAFADGQLAVIWLTYWLTGPGNEGFKLMLRYYKAPGWTDKTPADVLSRRLGDVTGMGGGRLSISPNGQVVAYQTGDPGNWGLFDLNRSIQRDDMWSSRYHISIPDDSHLLVDEGIIGLDAALAGELQAWRNRLEEESPGIDPIAPDIRGCGLTFPGDWIIFDGRKLLWLPFQYRKIEGRRIANGEYHIFISSLAGIFSVHLSPDIRDHLSCANATQSRDM